jgi:hypothetical protein
MVFRQHLKIVKHHGIQGVKACAGGGTRKGKDGYENEKDQFFIQHKLTPPLAP